MFGADSQANGNAALPVDETVVSRIFREEYGRSVASLIRAFGDIDAPPNPGGWITTTARNLAIDRQRREARGRELLREVAVLLSQKDDPGTAREVGPVEDDRLRLIFTCCHPALSTEAQVALTLRLLGGLSTEEVARSFVVAEATMAQRIVRAKRKIKAARILYLLYNAGPPTPAEPDLRREAIRLARVLSTLMPNEPEVAGLLALLLLTESRRASRSQPDGSLVLLGEQDRTRWDRALIEEGQAIVRRYRRHSPPGQYLLQAAINAVHADALTVQQTDWSQIVALYDQLLAVSPTPVVALNRAIAIGEVQGPAAALRLVNELDLGDYYPFHATRADLLRRLGRADEAAAAYERAAALAPTKAERDFLRLGGRASR